LCLATSSKVKVLVLELITASLLPPETPSTPHCHNIIIHTIHHTKREKRLKTQENLRKLRLKNGKKKKKKKKAPAIDGKKLKRRTCLTHAPEDRKEKMVFLFNSKLFKQ